MIGVGLTDVGLTDVGLTDVGHELGIAVGLGLPDPLVWLGLAVLLGFSVQTALGFGGGLISMSLAALWMPIQEVVPLIVPLSIVQSGTVLLGEREHVAWRPLVRLVAPAMAVGLGVGLWLATVLVEHDAVMRRGYGGLVIAMALHGLGQRPLADEATAAPQRVRAAVVTVVAGVVHGLFATGGPPLAHAAHCLRLQRDAFRTTLLCTFLGTNVVMVIVFAAQDRLRVASAGPLVVLLGAVVLAVPVGRGLARRLPEVGFRRAVYAMLMITGLSLVI